MGCTISKPLVHEDRVQVESAVLPKTVAQTDNKFAGAVRSDAKARFASPFELAASSGGHRVADAKLAAATISAALTSTDGLTTNDITLYDTLNFACEGPRLEALRNCALLDTAPEGRFDAITDLAASFFDVPVCVVSLVDADRGWFKSNHGPFPGCVHREGSFCSYITVPDFAEMLIVEDCTKDARFSHNPYVMGPPELRYYAGCPLVTSMGHRIGTLCLCDFKPRRFPASAYNVMCNLAEIIVREAERDVIQRMISGTGVDSIASGGLGLSNNLSDLGTKDGAGYCMRLPPAPAAREPVVMIDVSDPTWPIVFANEAWAELVAVESGGYVPGLPATLLTHFADEEENGGRSVVRTQFWLASRDQLKNAVPVGIPGFVAAKEEAAEPMPTMPLGALWIGTAQVISGSVDTNLGSGSSTQSSRSTRSMRSVGSNFAPRSSVDGPAPTKPQRMAKIKLGPLIGQGSYGKVYRGSIGDKVVAVKVLDVPLAIDIHHLDSLNEGSGKAVNDGETTAEKAMLEAVLSRHLAHPNIVPTLEYFVNPKGSTRGTQEVWIVQHLCDRGTLYDALDRGYLRNTPELSAAPSFSIILATALDIASALRYLHEENIVHGDLSGNNVMLSSSPNSRGFLALLTDFGLSRALPGEMQTQTIGTVTHMPPELLVDGTLTKSADAYAFGVLLWEMWSGKRAWAGAALGNVIFQVTCLNNKLQMPESCPEPLRELANACMETEHTDRPTFAEIVERLEHIQAELQE